METLELDRTTSEASSAVPRPRRVGDAPARLDRDRENAEDLALFREFLAGRQVALGGGLIAHDQDAAHHADPDHHANRQSREAFTKIYLRYRERVYAYALRVLSNEQDAEDLFQEVFYRVYTRAESFTE